MAQFPSLDLLSEIDELASFVDGKSVENNISFLNDEDLDIGNCCDLPITDTLWGDDDSMLAVDSSNKILMNDPLFNMFGDQGKDLLSLQSASPDFTTPETLIPVSLPAHHHDEDDDSTSHKDDVGNGSTQPEGEEQPSCKDSACVETLENQGNESSDEIIDVDSPTVVATSLSVSSGLSPVRIIVNTTREQNRKMVAPPILPKPSHNLVKIPKTEPKMSTMRLKRLRTGNKLGPVKMQAEHEDSNICNLDSDDQPVSVISQSKLLEEASPSHSTRSEPLDGGESPFWSMRSRHSSGSSSGSQSSSAVQVKRKAYELEPLDDPRMERCRKNAINAKKNRELKKAHMVELELKVKNISRERDELAGENESLREAKLKLEQQVKHLNNILKNQSQLSTLIGKLSTSSVVLGDMSSSENEDAVVSSGMCLHVDGQEATIEYCSYCAKKAGKKFKL